MHTNDDNQFLYSNDYEPSLSYYIAIISQPIALRVLDSIVLSVNWIEREEKDAKGNLNLFDRI